MLQKIIPKTFIRERECLMLKNIPTWGHTSKPSSKLYKKISLYFASENSLLKLPSLANAKIFKTKRKKINKRTKR